MPERLECEVLQKARYINTLTLSTSIYRQIRYCDHLCVSVCLTWHVPGRRGCQKQVAGTQPQRGRPPLLPAPQLLSSSIVLPLCTTDAQRRQLLLNQLLVTIRTLSISASAMHMLIQFICMSQPSSFAWRNVNAWNSLPEHVVNCKTTPTFKRRLSTVDLTQFVNF